MCKHFRWCAECPAHGVICGTIGETNDAERLVQIVEAWAKEHPRKTRQDEFLEQYPEADLDKYGVLRCCPCFISPAYREREGRCKQPEKRCTDCRREFWMQEMVRGEAPEVGREGV